MSKGFMDFYARAQHERSLPAGSGIPEFEQAAILAQAKLSPGLTKSQLAMGTDMPLKYIDYLVDLHFLARHDFRYYVTPTGLERLREIRGKIGWALSLVLSA